MIGDPASTIPHALRASYHRPGQNSEVSLAPAWNFILSVKNYFHRVAVMGNVACGRRDILSVPRSGQGEATFP